MNGRKIICICLIVLLWGAAAGAAGQDDAVYWYDRAQKISDLDVRIGLLKKAISLDASFMEAYRDLGIAYFQQGNMGLSEKYLNQAAELFDVSGTKKEKPPVSSPVPAVSSQVTRGLPAQYQNETVQKKTATADPYASMAVIRKQLEFRRKPGRRTFPQPAAAGGVTAVVEADQRGSVLDSISNLFLEGRGERRDVPEFRKPEPEPAGTDLEGVEPEADFQSEPEIAPPPLPEFIPAPAGEESRPAPSEPAARSLNLNTVTVEQLRSVPLITEVDAILIVKYRQQYGAYTAVADLKNIPGFKTKFDSIKKYFFIGDIKQESDNTTSSQAPAVQESPRVPAPAVSAPEPAAPAANRVVNINTASKQELKEVLELGTLEALMIIKYRDKYGQFKTKEEFRNIPLIGSWYDKLQNRIVVE